MCYPLPNTDPSVDDKSVAFKWSSKSAAIPQGSTPVETALLLCSSCEGRESRNQRILLSIWIPQNTPSSREFSKVAHVDSSPRGISKKHCRSCWRYTEFCFQILKIETHHIYLTVLCVSLPERVSPSDILYDSISGFLGALWLKEWVFPSSLVRVKCCTQNIENIPNSLCSFYFILLRWGTFCPEPNDWRFPWWLSSKE